MRTTRLSILLPVTTVLLALPTLAAANCYSVFDAKNRLILQSTVAPVDLSTRISDGVRSRFPGGHLVMIPDESACQEMRTGPTTSPRFDGASASGAPAEETIQASPLLRGGATPATGGELNRREAVRSGNALNIKRATP